MTSKEIQAKAKFSFGAATLKDCKWLAKIKANRTLWLDECEDILDDTKPYAGAPVEIKRNSVLFIYEEDDVIAGFKYVGRLASGSPKIGWKTLKDAIEDDSFEILEFTEQCKKLYLGEVADND